MHNHRQPISVCCDRNRLAAVLAITMLFTLVFVFSASVRAQSGRVIYNFTGAADGAYPLAGLTVDAAGNLYGTTCGQACPFQSGSNGTVFRLFKRGSAWVFNTLYTFRGGTDGAVPGSRVVFGPDGSLYGTTIAGGIGSCDFYQMGCGTVFKLTPPATVLPNVVGGWTKTVLYRFTGGLEGANPYLGDVIFDHAGNVYGTTFYGGANNFGTVYKLTPTDTGWMESVLYSFSTEAFPSAGLTFDQSGNLYGTTLSSSACDFYYCGTVFQLTPSDPSWTERVLYGFQGNGDGTGPAGGVTFDQHGNLYGTTSADDLSGYGGGTLFKLDAQNGWRFDLLYHFTGAPQYFLDSARGQC